MLQFIHFVTGCAAFIYDDFNSYCVIVVQNRTNVRFWIIAISKNRLYFLCKICYGFILILCEKLERLIEHLMTLIIFTPGLNLSLLYILCERTLIQHECEWVSWSHSEYYALDIVTCACVAVRDFCRAECNPFCLLFQEFEFGWFKVSVLLRFKWLLSSALTACHIKLPESHKTCLNVMKNS